MVSSKASTVSAYLAELPPDRRKVIAAARTLVRRHLPPGYKEAIGYGMITWTVPLSRYPDTSNGQPLCYVGLAAQKRYNTLYLMSPYADPALYAWLADEFRKAGKTFDMGKSCLHFRTMDDLVPEAVARVVAGTTPAQLIAAYEASRTPTRRRPAR